MAINMAFLISLWLLLCVGHVSTTYTMNDTWFYNVTGTFYARVGHARDILDIESHSYKEIAGNLTRGFLKIFTMYRKLPFDYNMTVTKLFLWPTSREIETDNKQSLSFVLISRYAFQTTPESKFKAERFVKHIFDTYKNIYEKNGTVELEGLAIKKDTLVLEKTTKEEVKSTIRVLNGYMTFITKLTDGGDGDTKPADKKEHGVIVVISYVGITLSVAGLAVTVFSICYFRRLRSFRGNQILVHICLTVMTGMIFSVVAFLQKGGKTSCTSIAILLHYFILAAVSWMCVEAYNLYRDLVQVFNTNTLSTRAFFTRACLFAYGMPAVVVSIVAMVDLDIYGQRDDACWMTSLAFLVSFLVPVLLIVSVNAIFFVMIMREIVQVSQRDAKNIKPSLRAAISLSVLLGFCWLLAGIATFYSHVFFRSAFVLMSSFQGLFIFIFHGIGKEELRESWKSLAIFKWQFYTLPTSTKSNGRAKTESTQDSLQTGMRHSQETKTEDRKQTVSSKITDCASEMLAAQEGPLKTASKRHTLPKEDREEMKTASENRGAFETIKISDFRLDVVEDPKLPAEISLSMRV